MIDCNRCLPRARRNLSLVRSLPGEVQKSSGVRSIEGSIVIRGECRGIKY